MVKNGVNTQDMCILEDKILRLIFIKKTFELQTHKEKPLYKSNTIENGGSCIMMLHP